MDLKVIYKNARCAVLEIEDGGTYEASRMYRIYLNGEFIRETGKAVTSIYNLKPDTGYQVEARSGDSLVFKTSFTTDSEYVTLDVRDFGAKGDGIQDVGISPISSKKIVPLWASSKSPIFPLRLAPVNAPSSYPKSSLSRIPSGRAAQFTATKGPFLRLLAL